MRRFFGDYRTFAFDPDYFHLGIGEIANITDDATWQRIMQDFDSDPRVVSRATMYSGTRGEHEANQAMAEHIGNLLGRSELGEQHVVPYDGGHNAVNGVIRACVAPLGSPQDERQYVLLPTPCYPYFSTILNAHCGVIAYTAYSAEEMVRGIRTLINHQVGVVLLNTPHNPTGYALTPEQVGRINRAVAPYDCVLAMDMVYALNALDPQAMRTLGGLDPERTIYIDSFSKKFGCLPRLSPGFCYLHQRGAHRSPAYDQGGGIRLDQQCEIALGRPSAAAPHGSSRDHCGHDPSALSNVLRGPGPASKSTVSHCHRQPVTPTLSISLCSSIRLLERTGLQAEEFGTLCHERYKIGSSSWHPHVSPGGPGARHVNASRWKRPDQRARASGLCSRLCRDPATVRARLVRYRTPRPPGLQCVYARPVRKFLLRESWSYDIR